MKFVKKSIIAAIVIAVVLSLFFAFSSLTGCGDETTVNKSTNIVYECTDKGCENPSCKYEVTDSTKVVVCKKKCCGPPFGEGEGKGPNK